MRSYIFCFVVLLSSVLAESEEAFVQHGTHEHGAALLNIVLDGPDLVMEFISPAINIVGFEYAPSTDEQVKLVEAAVSQLGNGEALFELTARAKCQLTNTEVESELSEEDKHSVENEEVEKVEDLEEAPQNKNFFKRLWKSIWFRNKNNQEVSTENEHLEVDEDSEETVYLEESEIVEEDGHDDEAEESETHSEFHAVYEFTCESPNHLQNIDLNNLFVVYPGIEDLDVQFVLPDRQGAKELNKDNTNLQF